jgi:hypothetical protein
MLAWRALALLQEELEREEGAPKPPNAVDEPEGPRYPTGAIGATGGFPAMYGGEATIDYNTTAGGMPLSPDRKCGVWNDRLKRWE